MAQHVRSQSAAPRPAATSAVARPARAQRLGAHPPAADGPSRAFAGQHRRVRVRPVGAELVPHLGQPPVDQRSAPLIAGYQPRLGTTPALPLP